jgi:hypothetical protein
LHVLRCRHSGCKQMQHHSPGASGFSIIICLKLFANVLVEERLFMHL